MVPPCSDRISRVPPYSRILTPYRIRGYHPYCRTFPDRSATDIKTTGLFRVRSPLLAESLLMSFPPGTEMFQFPGFASTHYVFMCRSSFEGVAPFGYPRINACSRLPMAFRSVPRPSSPPDAKASTECSYRALDPGYSAQQSVIGDDVLLADPFTMHRNKTRYQESALSFQSPEYLTTDRWWLISDDSALNASDRIRRGLGAAHVTMRQTSGQTG